jgi:hypothetical protein
MEDFQLREERKCSGKTGRVSEDVKIEMVALRHTHCLRVTSL